MMLLASASDQVSVTRLAGKTIETYPCLWLRRLDLNVSKIRMASKEGNELQRRRWLTESEPSFREFLGASPIDPLT